MKIALVRFKYSPYGGAERYMARLIDGLLTAGHEVHVFAADWEGDSTAGLSLHKVPVVKLFSWLRVLSFAFNCRAMLRAERFDIISSLERTLHQDVYRAGDGCHRRWLIQKNLGKSVFAKAATFLNPLHLAYLYLERKLFTDPALAAIIVNAESVAADITAMYGVAPDKIRLVRNGLDASLFFQTDRTACREKLAAAYGLTEELRLLYVGSGFERKGVATIIRALPKVTVPVRLIVVGKGNPAPYRKLAERLGVGDRVHFTGPVRNVADYYLGSDVFVFPTRYDPFSNATLEAMAAGLPVVTSRFNGVAELLIDGVDGFVTADPLDDDAVALAIEQLADAGLRSSMSVASQKISAQLTIERNVTETLAIFADILQQKSA